MNKRFVMYAMFNALKWLISGRTAEIGRSER